MPKTIYIWLDEKVLTVKEASLLLKKSLAVIRRRVHAGILIEYNPDTHRPKNISKDEVDSKKEGSTYLIRYNGEWKTTKEIADFIGVNASTVNKWRNMGILSMKIRTRNRDNLYEGQRARTAKKGYFTSQAFFPRNDNELPTTLGEFYDNIIQCVRTRPSSKNLIIKLRFVDKDGSFIFMRRKIGIDVDNLITKNQFVDMINNIIENPESKDYNEDFEDSRLNTSFFEISNIEEKKSGGSSDHHSKPGDSNNFKIRAYGNYKDYIDEDVDKKNNCLLYIVKKIIGIGSHCETIRKNLGFDKGKPIDISELPVIESTYDICIKVFNKNGDIEYYNNTEQTNSVDVLLHDGHYFHIEKHHKLTKYIDNDIYWENDKKNKRAKIEIKYINVFFDIETYNDKNNEYLTMPWACCWNVESTDKVIIEYGYDCIRKFCKFIISPPENCAYRLIGYNNARFDNYLMTGELQDLNQLKGVIFANNTLYDVFSFSESRFFDLCQFTKSSLSEACSNFCIVDSKIKGFNHEVVQNFFEDNNISEEFKNNKKSDLLDRDMAQLQFESGKFHNWLQKNKVENDRYITYDVLSLKELFNVVNKSVKSLTGRNIYDYMTLASMGYKIFSEKQSFETYKNKNLDEKIFRDSMVGGRVQSFIGCKKVEEDLFFGDINSLYPSVMIDNEYPVGGMRYAESYEEGKLGIYSVIINQETSDVVTDGKEGLKKPTVIPYRSLDDGVPLDWSYRGDIKRMMTSVDIECAKRAGYKIKYCYDIYQENCDEEDVGEYFVGYCGVIFDKTSKTLFDDYIKPFMKEKIRQDNLKKNNDVRYNVGIRTMCKLFMNALSGKLLQRNFDTEKTLIKTDKDADKFFNTCVNRDDITDWSYMNGGLIYIESKKREEKIMSRPKPSYIGSFIYSYARTLMYDNILSKYLVYYTDTDSALVSVRTSRKMRHLMGGNFGQMSDDLNGSKVDSSYIVSAKSYGLFCDNKLVKGRCKGVRPRDTYLIGEYDDESHPFVADRDKVFVCDEEFYSSLCNGEKLSISCDVFKKGIGLDENGKKYFKLCHARMIKVI